MSDWPLPPGNRYFESIGVSTGTSKATTIAAHASTNTKGSWVELVASSAHPSDSISIFITGYVAGASSTDDYLFDIAVGAAASEQVIVENCLTSFNAAMYRYGMQIDFPISIPAGSRVSARCQTTLGTTGTMILSALLGSTTHSNIPQIGKSYTFGANTADSGGTSIDPGAVAHTKGSWVELTASTEIPLKSLMIAIGSQENSVRTSMYSLFDIGIGAAASETVIIPNLPIAVNTAGDLLGPAIFGPIDISIPTGSRIAVRSQADITDATDRLFDIVIYGGA